MARYIGRFKVTPTSVLIYLGLCVVAYLLGHWLMTRVLGPVPETVTTNVSSDIRPAHSMRFMIHPCEREDSNNCYWDARQRANGRGHSFYAIRVGHRDCIVYWNTRYNRHHGKCYPHTNPKENRNAVSV